MMMLSVAASVTWPRSVPLMATLPVTKITPLKLALRARVMGHRNAASPAQPAQFRTVVTRESTAPAHGSQLPIESHVFKGAQTPAVDVTPVRNLPYSVSAFAASLRNGDPPR
jgi:hypothetical protein